MPAGIHTSPVEGETEHWDESTVTHTGGPPKVATAARRLISWNIPVAWSDRRP